MKRIIIADDHPLFCVGLRYALKAKGFSVLAEVHDGQAAIETCFELQPDVILLDVKMPVFDGIEACRRIRLGLPELVIVMLTTFEEPAIIQAAKQAGATAYLSKETPPEKLASLLADITLRPSYTWFPETDVPSFTDRESQIILFLADGLSNKAMARELGISPETVKDNLEVLYRKLGVGDRLSAVRVARGMGLLLLSRS